MPKFLALFLLTPALYGFSCFVSGYEPCNLLGSRAVVFNGTAIKSELSEGLSPFPIQPNKAVYKITFKVDEALYGIDANSTQPVFSLDPIALETTIFVYATRLDNGQIILPSYGDCPSPFQSSIGLPERFLKYLREAKRLKLKNGALNIRAYNDFERTNGSPNIEVRIIGPVTRKGRSGPQGLIVFKDLPPGKYKVEATLGELTLVQEQTEVEVAPLSCNWFGAHLNYPRKNP
jgi:hypothetical protein